MSEGHVNHTNEVLLRVRERNKVLEVGDKKMAFGDHTALRIKDDGIANEVKQKYPNEVIVDKIRYPTEDQRNHKYFFGSWPEMPWKRGQDAGSDKRENVSQSQSGGELSEEDKTEHQEP